VRGAPRQLRGDEGGQAADDVLGQGQLPSVAGDDEDREAEEHRDQRDRGGKNPLHRQHPSEQDHQHRVADEKRDDAHPPGTDGREPVEDKAAQRQPPSPDQYDRDDDQECGAIRPTGIAHVPGGQRLADADHEGAEESQRERCEIADERRGDGWHDEQGQLVRFEERDGCDQDAGQARQAGPDHPVDGGDRVRRVAQRGGRPLVLGYRRSEPAEGREAVGRPEQRGDNEADHEDDDDVKADRHGGKDVDAARRQVRRDGEYLMAVMQRGGRLQGNQQAQRRNHPRERRGVAHRAQHDQLHEGTEQRGHCDGQDHRRPEAQASARRELIVGVGTDHHERALREVDDAGTPVDGHQSGRYQGVQGPNAQAEDCVADDFHAESCLPGVPTITHPGRLGRPADQGAKPTRAPVATTWAFSIFSGT